MESTKSLFRRAAKSLEKPSRRLFVLPSSPAELQRLHPSIYEEWFESDEPKSFGIEIVDLEMLRGGTRCRRQKATTSDVARAGQNGGEGNIVNTVRKELMNFAKQFMPPRQEPRIEYANLGNQGRMDLHIGDDLLPDELRRQNAVAAARNAHHRFALGDGSPLDERPEEKAVAGDRAGRDVLAGTVARADTVDELALQGTIVASGKASPAKRSLSEVEQEIEDAMAAKKARQAAAATKKAKRAKAKKAANKQKRKERRGLQR